MEQSLYLMLDSKGTPIARGRVQGGTGGQYWQIQVEDGKIDEILAHKKLKLLSVPCTALPESPGPASAGSGWWPASCPHKWARRCPRPPPQFFPPCSPCRRPQSLELDGKMLFSELWVDADAEEKKGDKGQGEKCMKFLFKIDVQGLGLFDVVLARPQSPARCSPPHIGGPPPFSTGSACHHTLTLTLFFPSKILGNTSVSVTGRSIFRTLTPAELSSLRARILDMVW